MRLTLRRRHSTSTGKRKGKRNWSPDMWLLVMGFALLLVLLFRNIARYDAMLETAQQPKSLMVRTADTVWDSTWQPLPATTELPLRPVEEVRALYAYAARRGDLLQYVPCFCGCERDGHHSNHACYIKGRADAANPRWDMHAFT